MDKFCRCYWFCNKDNDEHKVIKFLALTVDGCTLFTIKSVEIAYRKFPQRRFSVGSFSDS